MELNKGGFNMTRLEALEMLQRVEKHGTVAEVATAIDKVLETYFLKYLERHEVYVNLISNSVIKLFSGVEIEQKYLEKFGHRIVIRCPDKYAHVFTEALSEDMKTIKECFSGLTYVIERV